MRPIIVRRFYFIYSLLICFIYLNYRPFIFDIILITCAVVLHFRFQENGMQIAEMPSVLRLFVLTIDNHI